MLTGKGIHTIRRELYGDIDNQRTHAHDLKPILSRHGLRLGRKVESNCWTMLLGRPLTALVAIRFRSLAGADYWHWVIFDGTRGGGTVYDPQKGIRRDWGRMRLAFYHIVERTN